MAEYPRLLFEWASRHHGVTGAVLLVAGLICGLYGFRLMQFVVVLCSSGLGYAGGALAAESTGWPRTIVAPAAAVFCGAIALACPRAGLAVGSGGTWGLLGAYFGAHFGPRGFLPWVGLGLLGTAGTLLAVVSRRTMGLVLTSVLGAGLTIVGFGGVAGTLLPVVGDTFRSWVQHRSPVLPVLLAMLATTAYSCQANARRGDVRVGPAGEGDDRAGRTAR